jgi:hypothetical protein
MVGVIEAGIEAGQLRPVEPRVAAYAILGMCNWLAWWYKAGPDELPPERLAAVFADIAVEGLQLSDYRAGAGEAPPVQRAIQLLRQDLDLLEAGLANGNLNLH